MFEQTVVIVNNTQFINIQKVRFVTETLFLCLNLDTDVACDFKFVPLDDLYLGIKPDV